MASPCSNCQTEVSDGAAACPSCGSPMNVATATPSGASPQSGTTQIKFDASVLSQTDRIVGIATLVLFISLFLSWFSVNLGSGFGSASADGLTAHGYLYITLFVCLGILGYLALGALGIWKLPESSPVGHDQVLLAATGVNLVLVVLAFVLKPGGYGVSGVGWSFGAFVGLVAAIVAAAPVAMPAIRARRAK